MPLVLEKCTFHITVLDVKVVQRAALLPHSPRVPGSLLTSGCFPPVSYVLVGGLVILNESLGARWCPGCTGIPSRMYSHVPPSVPGIESGTRTRIKCLLNMIERM